MGWLGSGTLEKLCLSAAGDLSSAVCCFSFTEVITYITFTYALLWADKR